MSRVNAYLPYEWAHDAAPSDGGDGPPVSDPLTIYVADQKDDEILLQTSLFDLVWQIRGCRTPAGVPTFPLGEDKVLAGIAAALRALADQIEGKPV